MIKYCPKFLTVLALLGMVSSSALVFGQSSEFLTYTDPTSGESYFALSVKPSAPANTTSGRDVVVLVDTSASMSRQYRQQALESLTTFVAGLQPTDRVRLIACDTSATPLTNDFVAPTSAEFQAAVSQLSQRVPLGTTDMGLAIKTAADSSFDANNSSTIVYLGEGSSRARLLSTDEFQQLGKDLVEKKVSFNALALGPDQDLRFLGTMTSLTGGMLVKFEDSAASTPEAISASAALAQNELVSAVRGDVIWPDSKTIEMPADFEVSAKEFPPMRTDRDSVILGKFKGNGPFDVKVNTSVGPQQWTVPQVANTADVYNYLKPLYEMSKDSPLPLAGKSDLDSAKNMVLSGVVRNNILATKALTQNDLLGAQTFVDAALRDDPNDPNALELQKIIAAKQEANGQAGLDLNLSGGPDDNVFLDSAGLLESASESANIITQQVIGEVTQAINNATAQLRIDPEGAIQNLKNQLEGVRRNMDISAQNREQLCRNLERAIRDAQNQSEDLAAKNAAMAQIKAGQIDRKIAADQMLNQQEKIYQMGKRFEALVKEKKFTKAEEEVAAEMVASMDDLDRMKTTAIAGTIWARSVGYYNSQMENRTLRYKKLADTLYQVDRAAIPFPDEPPIVYPDAEVWKRLSARRIEKYKSMDLAQKGSAEKKIMDALKEPTSMDFSDTPLEDVINELKSQHNIEIQLDMKALGDAMLDPADMIVKKSFQGISLRSAMKLMLRDLGLTYVIQDEVLLVTTEDEAITKLSTKVYPVADLVIPIQMPDMQDVFQNMGGNNSNLGGNSNSGGNGGNNMFGGGGGGGFNIPAELRQNIMQNANQGANMGNENPVNFNGAFNVTDDLSQPVPAAPSAVKVRSRKAGAAAPLSLTARPAEPVQTIQPATVKAAAQPATEKADVNTAVTSDGKVIVPPAGVDKSVFWTNYFRAGKIDSTMVRNTVLALKHRNRFSEAITLLNCAIIEGQQEPWMYEALAICQICDGRPQAEYERTLMSAIDFCDDVDTMMLIAVYLDRLGLADRAIQVYREISQRIPDNGQPYVRALKIAQRTNNFEAKRWSALGILSLAWQDDQQNVYQDALNTVNGMYEELVAAKKTREAAAMKQDIAAACERDCMVRISWTGNADVDIAVEEPGGTICSLKNLQTTAGGNLLGDVHAAQLTRDNHGIMSETYVCPKGFSGDYRVLVKKVWGEVVGNKVKVELFVHTGSKLERKMVSKLDLEDNQAGMMFALHDGRRTENLEQHQLANSVRAIADRAVLAQQLAQAFDGAALANLATSNDVSLNGGNNNSPFDAYYPYLRSGAVGYQPQIVTLPTGTNFVAQAVVSADRRYVRITSVPLFSYIASVRIFNYVSGEETAGDVPAGTGNSYGGGGGMNNNNGGGMNNNNGGGMF